VVATPKADSGLEDAWSRLRLLAIGHAAGWFEYVAADAGEGRYLLRLPGGGWRELRRGEVRGYVRGIADASHDGATAQAWAALPTPEMLDIRQTGQVMGLSEPGVKDRFKRGTLYPVFVMRRNLRERYCLAAQVRADLVASAATADERARAAREAEEALRRRETADRLRGLRDAALAEAGRTAQQAMAEWQQLRGLLPPANRIADRTDYTGPAPSPDPLPYSNERPTARRAEALSIGDQEGWFAFRHGDAGRGVYVVEVAQGDEGCERVLEADDVLSYVLGHADRCGHADLVAYRDGLG
jgi:hypothetical protein